MNTRFNIRSILLVSFMFFLPAVMWADKEPWVGYTDGTLTFHYDENRASSTEADKYDLPTGESNPGWWASHFIDVQKVVFDESFGEVRPQSCYRWFYELSNLTEIQGIEHLNTSEVTTMESMFDGCKSLTELDLRTFDTRGVTNMYAMFYNNEALTTIYVSDLFVTDQVTSSEHMFESCTSLPSYQEGNDDKSYAKDYLSYVRLQPWVEYQEATHTLTFRYNSEKYYTTATARYDLPAPGQDPGWLAYSDQVKKVVFDYSFKDARPERCTKWFCNMSNLTEMKSLSYLNTDSVNDMSDMFYGCSSLSVLDLSHFNTERVTTMKEMFCGCDMLTTLNVTSFCTSRVDNMESMFQGCRRLTSLTLRSFDTRGVTNMNSMFFNDRSLTTIYVSDLFVTDKVTNSEFMFYDCLKLPSYNKKNIDKTYVPVYMTFVRVEPWVEYQEATHRLTFHYDDQKHYTTATGRYDLPASGQDPGWLAYSDQVEKVVFDDNFTDARPERCHKWFYNMSNLTDIENLSYLNTTSVSDLSSMFYGCSSLTELDLSHFNTERVTTMKEMFCGCSMLTTLDVTSFSTPKVNNMESMFQGCDALTRLELGSFDTRGVTNMSYMFNEDQGLTAIYVSDLFATDKVTSSTSMFGNCQLLLGFDENSVGKEKACFYPKGYLYNTARIMWTAYDHSAHTLTFHYEALKDSCKATYIYDVPLTAKTPEWVSAINADTITVEHVIFGSDFAPARPKVCYGWFSGMKDLTDIEGFEHLNTSEVTTMESMFRGCTKLTELDVTGFNTANVVNTAQMFSYCSALTELNFSTWDLSSDLIAKQMFYNCSSLEHIYVSEAFALNNSCSGEQMFVSCNKLPHFSSHDNDKAMAHYKEGGYLTLRRHATVGDTLYNIDGYAQPTCYDDVTFTDGAAFASPCAFTFDTDHTASYTRTMKNHWATLCLPFAFSAEDNPSASYYSVKRYTEGTITATPLTGEIAAGTPVLAYVTDGELSVTATGAAAVAIPATDDVLQGVFTQTEVADKDYIIANDHFWNALYLKQQNTAAQHVYVAPYRASLTLSLATEAKPNSISIADPTGVSDSLRRIEDTDPSALLDGAELYDLQGRRIAAPQRGMMIIRKGGVSHKVVVR